MKKQFKKYAGALVILIALVAGSCTDLSETVYSELLADEFVPTEKDIPYIIAPVYTAMRPMMAGWQGMFDVQEESADQIVTPSRPNGWYDGGTYQRMHKHTWTPTQSQPQNLWNSCYRGINTANRVIYQIESGEIPMTSGKENLIAELKAVRAYYYSVLIDSHGNVPVVTDFKALGLPEQSTRQEVYDFVVSELLATIPLLSENVDMKTYGRFNKWAAKATLARVYLNAGVYTGTPQWALAIEQCNDIIASTKFQLETYYRDVFKTFNENSKEIIFAVPYDETKATQWQIHMKTLDPLSRIVYKMEATPWGGNCAVPQWINTYDPDDQRLKDTWIQGPQYHPDNGTVVIEYLNFVRDIELAEINQGYRIGKYEIKIGAKSGLSNDYVVFRYADILMMKAECLLRTNHEDDAATIVTEVRQRSFKSNPVKATVTGAQLLLGSSYNYGFIVNGVVTEATGGADIQYGRFLDELGWEFAAEGRRRTDLIRFGIFHTKTWMNHRPTSIAKALFPIPQAEMNKNPNLTQNPSY